MDVGTTRAQPLGRLDPVGDGLPGEECVSDGADVVHTQNVGALHCRGDRDPDRSE